MRHLLSLLLLLPLASRADEVDLSQPARSLGQPATLVLRLEGGSAFGPYGYVGGCVSYFSESQFELEAGAGGGFPGLQLGLAARRLFGDGTSFLVTELALAGNTRVNRGQDANPLLSVQAAQATSSLWTGLGAGFERRGSLVDFSVVGSLVLTTASLTPHFSVHGGVGLGF